MQTIADKGVSILIHEMEVFKGQLNAAREALKECTVEAEKGTSNVKVRDFLDT